MLNKSLRFPIKWGIIYSIFTIIMYLFGVWIYPSTNRGMLLVLLFAYNISMYYGFLYGTKHDLNLSFKKNENETLKEGTDKLVWKFYKICFWITFLLLVPRFIIYTGLYQGLSIATIISRVQFTISDVNQAYMDSHTINHNARGIWRVINLVSVLTSGFSWSFTPIVIALWKKIKTSHKVFAVFYWIVYCIQYVLSATNSGIVGQIFYIAISWCLVTVYKRYKSGISSNNSKKDKLKITIIMVLAALSAMSIFGYAMSSRVGINYRSKYIGICNIVYNKNSVFNTVTPESFHPTLAVADSYLTQGYCALELSISEDWVPTFLLGNSRFLMSNFYELTGINLFDNTYQMRLYRDTGWHYNIYWHTAYLWLANDFSLYFLPAFLFVLFSFFGFCWKVFIKNNNVFGLLGTVLFAQFMFYISANNNLFSLSDTLFAFILVLFMVIYSRKFNWEQFAL